MTYTLSPNSTAMLTAIMIKKNFPIAAPFATVTLAAAIGSITGGTAVQTKRPAMKAGLWSTDRADQIAMP
jgi:hypothetical protein